MVLEWFWTGFWVGEWMICESFRRQAKIVGLSVPDFFYLLK